MSLDSRRVETLLVSRAYTARDRISTQELLAPLSRFGPTHLTPAAWQSTLEDTLASLRGKVIGDDNRLITRDELRARIGHHNVTKWQQLADRVLPGIGLSIAPDDAKVLGKLSSAESWAAAIVARARGTWSGGSPPTASALCDGLAWERLGLTGKAKRLPAEVRSLFLQKELATDSAKYERLLRQLAARELGVPRTDSRALRDGLVRSWLAGKSLGAQRAPTFAADVSAIARTARDGVFGDRKVFISEVWHQLRRKAPWADITLDDFKSRLLAAHRSGELVLARADLVAAMNPDLVAASETNANGASFHFVVREMP